MLTVSQVVRKKIVTLEIFEICIQLNKALLGSNKTQNVKYYALTV